MIKRQNRLYALAQRSKPYPFSDQNGLKAKPLGVVHSYWYLTYTLEIPQWGGGWNERGLNRQSNRKLFLFPCYPASHTYEHLQYNLRRIWSFLCGLNSSFPSNDYSSRTSVEINENKTGVVFFLVLRSSLLKPLGAPPKENGWHNPIIPRGHNMYS